MPSKKTTKKKYVKYHNDGSLWAKGTTIDGKADGCFEWFRKDGTKMRSGYFRKGKPVGEWTTYDRKGKVVRVSRMKE
jgi:antitoxin component YwqK of YwqJK toxin-antitoxin module